MNQDLESTDNLYGFVPTPLRHDFWRENDDKGDVVDAARRTRSARLVATLLYGDASTNQTSPRRKKPSKAQQETQRTEVQATLPLYSLAVELDISKRMAFTHAVQQLDAYFGTLRHTVDTLNGIDDVSSTPTWLWGPTIKLPTLLQLQRKIVQTVASCVPDCDIYLAIKESLPMANPVAAAPGPLLRYVAASPQSSMTGRVVYRDPTALEANNPSVPSFAVVDSLDPLLVPDVGVPGMAVKWLGRVDGQTVMTGPFACLPLVDARGVRGIGVLSLDACRKAAQLRPEAMSPQALFEFLVQMQLQDAATEFRKLQFGGRQFLQLTPNDLQHRPAYRTLKIQTKQRVVELITAMRRGLPLHLPRGKRPPFFSEDDEALALLDDVCERAGGFLDEYARRVHWHRVMAKRTKDVKSSVLDVYAVLVQGIAQALPSVERICVWKIRDCTDIDAIATTHLPDDRLAPFSQWNERQIRRVPLYTENNDDAGRLMQGNITRIHLPPTTTPAQQVVPLQPCERATYHVSWSNRTQQSLSWPQLRLILPIRPMNARHYQLSQLLKQLQIIRSESQDVGSGTRFRLTDPHAVVILQTDAHRPADVVYAVEVDILPEIKRLASTSSDIAVIGDIDIAETFIQRAVAITQQNLDCIRGREARSLRRQQSAVRTLRSFNSFSLSPSSDALRALDQIIAFVFNEISENLPGTQQQIAEVQSDGTELRYTFAGNGSTLIGKSLNRGQGVSFRCFDTRAPLIVDHNSELCHRLKQLVAGSLDMETDLPYIFLPLLYEDICLGVLSVNRFIEVPKGRTDETHPEEGIVAYLESLTKTVAAAIYLKRRAYALYCLQQHCIEPLRSPEQLFATTSRILHDTMIGVWKLRFVEVDFVRGKSTTVYEYSEAARLQAETVLAKQVIPLGYRARELLPDTIASHWNIPRDEADSLVQLWQKHESEAETERMAMLSCNAQSEMERRKVWEYRIRRRYYQVELHPLEDEPNQESSKSPPSHVIQAAHTRAPNPKYVVQALSTSLGSKAFAHAGVEALSIAGSSALYVAVATQPQLFATCEQNYVNRVAETLSRMTESLVLRIERSRKRVDALLQLELKCSSFVEKVNALFNVKPSRIGGFPLTPSEELRTERSIDLLDEVVRYIGTVLQCPSIYVALHEPFHCRLHYVAASPTSTMAGKVMHRGHGVSFYTLDQQQALVVTAATQELIEQQCGHGVKLRRFSSEPPERQKWPFIVVPMNTVGVLALDNLEKLTQLTDEVQPEFGLVDFLRRAAQMVGTAITAVRSLSRAHRRQRREEAVVRVMAACEDHSKRSSPLYLQHVVLQAIASAFNGVDAYIGMVQPLCSSLVFTSATQRSGMTNQQLSTLDCVSFRVFLSQRHLVIPQVERKQFDSTETQTAQLIHHLRWFTPSQDLGRKGAFVCIPIPFVGILSVDSFPGAASGVYSPHVPEHGVVECLTTLANLLGQRIREITAAETLRQIPKLFEGNRSTFRVVFTNILELIAKNVLSAVELCVICFDAESWTSVHDLTAPLVALKSSVDETPTHAHSYLTDLGPSITHALQSTRDGHPRCFCLHDHPEVIVLRCYDIRDVDSASQGVIDWQQSCRSLATAIVIRRVRGASWSYDQEFVQILVPAIDEIVQLVNVRVCGIASRANAMHALRAMCTALESAPSSVTAFESIPRFACDFVNIVAQSSSQTPGDCYLGERGIGCDTIEFFAASESSLMKGVKIDLLNADNQEMVSVNCLEEKRRLLVHLMDGRNDRLLRPLTQKKVQRLFAAFPMSEDRLFCIDSLSIEAFDPIHARLERDIESFLVDCSSLLETTISSVRYRYAYDQLCDLKSKRHKNFRKYFGTVHAVLRQELTSLHSQQVLELAEDFMGSFSVLSWHRCATKRAIRGSVPSHFCFINGCQRDLIAHNIHFEQHITLPMTNVPRTLDHSRAVMEPVSGREKQGAYACECLATMIDTGLTASAKLALCVYSHDVSSERNNASQNVSVARPSLFTSRQRQFFFAVGAVAAEVYNHVFRSCVLETFDVEQLFIARDRLNVKDAVLLVIDSCKENSDKQVRVVTSCSVALSKWMPGSTVNEKLALKVLEFSREANTSRESDFAVFLTRTPSVRRNAVQPEQTPLVPTATTASTSKAQETPVKHSFFKRPRLFGGKEKTPTISTNAPPIAQEIVPPAPLPTVEFLILMRGHHDGQVLSMQVEREIIEDQDMHELITLEVRHLFDEVSSRRSSFITNPRGDEEWNGVGFGHVAEIGEGNGCGGGGFHVMSCWTHWRAAVRDQIVHLETDMRSYLTGVQATSRAQLGTLVASNVRPGLLPTGTGTSQHLSIFSHENLPLRTAAITLVRSALCLCGYKKEVVLDPPSDKDDDMLKEYLRASIGRKLVELNVRTTAKWATAVRSSNYIKTRFNSVARLSIAMDTDSVCAARTLMAFLLAYSSAVKYFKFLIDSAKQRKQRIDTIATRIQCMYRVALAKKTLRKLKIEFAAAVAIQCAFRQHLARRKKAFLKWDRAARIVQRAYRRKLAQRRGRRPRKLTLELRSVAAQYGTMQATRLGKDLDAVDEDDDAWKMEMASFDSFKAFLDSRVGREQLKREEQVIAERLKEAARHREQTLTVHDRLLADAYDIFELLDIDGTGELSRERTQELMTRLHIPLSREEATDVIDMMDNDRSGGISFREFTNWFSHEFDVLKRRNRECGTLSRRDRQWIVEESARSAVRKRWRAHQTGAATSTHAPITTEAKTDIHGSTEEKAVDLDDRAPTTQV